MPLLRTPNGVARMPATPCRQEGVRRRNSEEAPGSSTPGWAPKHGADGRMYFLTREPIMPMLTLSQEEKPIIFRSFRPPLRSQALSGLQGRTLGTRVRRPSSSVPQVRFFEESPPQAAPAESSCEADAQAHRLVLWSPPPEDPEARQEVVVDPDVSRVLREHQRIGVQFLFDCLMGLKPFDGSGCILADDMGLGKTLQSVAVIWTLLTQGGPRGKPACRKALVVCPASLVKNWGAELDKWLKGKCKYVAVAVVGQAQVSGTFASFKYSHEHRVLIASYETFRGHASQVADCGIDLIVCDEAHKLKNDDAATTKCIAGLAAKRRLLISGTPIQNNLEEFFTLASVANPGIFGDIGDFRRRFAAPILRGREPTASAEERQRGEETLERLSEVTEHFILRRTNRLNARFLPPKQLFDVFVAPTSFQRRLYRSFLRSNVARKVLEDQNVRMNRTVLGTIKKLQGLVNHPFLVRSAGMQRLEAGFDDEEARAMFAEVDRRDSHLRSAQRPVHEELSGKLALLCRLLEVVKASRTGDRVVIISNWTMTLDIIEKMCGQRNWPVHRLDGTMAVAKRMKLVQDFNRPENERAFAFLLSSKAGGCGLNLIGANRLVMYDPDWNPANDRQAMARIWRDGQKKPCFIYRLFTTGTIDEKVYQRQICKDGLSTMMVTETGEAETAAMRESLSSELVKDLFTLAEDTICATHEMLGCQRCGAAQGVPGAAVRGGAFIPQEAEVVEGDLRTWSHHTGTSGVEDAVLVEAARSMVRDGSHADGECSGVTFVMGCHIEFTAEQIAKLEEEERAEQQARSAAASKEAAAPVTSPAGANSEPNSEPKPPGKRRRWKSRGEEDDDVQFVPPANEAGA
uniref:DNA repair and recombination protein RAD54-like n=1 Tax=Lingulaulax polyedra TaxID=160621 RepID=A0A516AGA3_LINPO|nr:DNA repair and recombination protein RAD54-like [Lingulodinium polyedra]